MSTEGHTECTAQNGHAYLGPDLLAMQSNDTPGLGLEVGLVLAEAPALGLALAVTWATWHDGSIAGPKKHNAAEAMGTCLARIWTNTAFVA